MKVPLQITFRDFPSSAAIEARIREEADKLERFHPRIISCRVVLERPHRHHHKGNVFRTAVLVTVPGADIEVTREPGTDHAHEDVYVSIRDAFDEARRRLDERNELRRSEVRGTRSQPPVGVVTQMFPEHGFIRGDDGREVYFHRNSVLNNEFDKLEVGSEVRFAEEMGDKGPQASTVSPVGKRPMMAPDRARSA